MRNDGLQAALLLAVLLLSSGCGLTGPQQQAAARLARASAGVGEFTAREFYSLRELTIEMNTRSIALNGKAKLTDLDESLNLLDVSARISAATALSSYGQLLLSLVEETQEEQLEAAAHHFVNSFKHVSEKKLSNNQLEALGTLIQKIGGLFVKRQKAKATKRIVKEAKDDVDKVCDLLIADFHRTGLRTAQGVDATSKRLKADAAVALAIPGMDYGSRLVAVGAYKLADDANSRLTVLGPRTVETLTTLKRAHTQLVQAMENDKVSIAHIQALGKQFKELADIARALRDK